MTSDESSGPAAEASASSNEDRITVVIVDDHVLVAEGVAAALSATQDIVVLDLADSCKTGEEAVRKHRPDVLLLDQRLPDGTGTDIIRSLLEICPTMKVLLVTASDTDEVLARAIEAGAAGVIAKGKRAASLVQAVRAAARDEAVITPEVLRRLMPRMGRRGRRIGDDLTAREREVLQLLSAGKSTRDLAGELFVSQATARNHVQSIMNKLGAHSRLEAVAIASRENIMETQ